MRTFDREPLYRSPARARLEALDTEAAEREAKAEEDAAGLFEPAADALRTLAVDIRDLDALRRTRAQPIVLLASAEATAFRSRTMAHAALARLARALPPGGLRVAADAQCAMLAGVVPLCADILDERAAAWLAVETARAA